jgi:hypothetical protein
VGGGFLESVNRADGQNAGLVVDAQVLALAFDFFTVGHLDNEQETVLPYLCCRICSAGRIER